MINHKRIGAIIIAVAIASISLAGGLKIKRIMGNQKNEIIQLKTNVKNANLEIDALTKETDEAKAQVASTRRDIEQTKINIDTKSREISAIEGEIAKAEEEIRIKQEQEKAKQNVSAGRTIKIKLTGYCSCSICCGEWAYKNPGRTASGTIAKFGTVAAPPSLPFGTKMKIQGYGDQIFTVEDTGSAVVHSNGVYVIDMWMPTHEQAYAVGNSIITATLLN